MTGPEHYLEAERLLGKAHITYGGRSASDDPALTAAEAQVHALLAIAAAAALSPHMPGDLRGWREAAGVPLASPPGA